MPSGRRGPVVVRCCRVARALGGAASVQSSTAAVRTRRGDANNVGGVRICNEGVGERGHDHAAREH